MALRKIRRHTMICGRRGLIGLFLCAALLATLYLARGHLLPPLAGWLDVGTAPEPSDYVMALGGGESTRPFVAAALIKAGLARRALLPKQADLTRDFPSVCPPPQEIARRVLEHRGVSAKDVVILDHAVQTTFDEAEALAKFLETAPDVRVTVVTNNYHTRRARWVFCHVIGDRAGQLRFVSAPTDGFQAETWWRSEEGIVQVVGEYLKLAFYLVRYRPLRTAAVLGAAALLLVVARYRRRLGLAKKQVSQE